jgi:hypothetical protein
MRPANSVSCKGGKYVDNYGDFVENNIDFVKDVHMMCVNFIMVLITVPEIKNFRYYFRTDLRNMGARVA